MTSGKPTGRRARKARATGARSLSGLGDLEAAIMDVVWRADAPVRVREVLEELEPRRKPAYTTVMTVMDNLYRKGWLSRQVDGRAYTYLATRSRIQAATDAVRDLLADSGDPTAALLYFARGATEAEFQALSRGLKERRRAR